MLLTKGSHQVPSSLGQTIASSSDTKSSAASGPLENLMKDRDLFSEKCKQNIMLHIISEDSRTSRALPQGLSLKILGLEILEMPL